MYQCPKCSLPLVRKQNSYQCKNRHTYDIAKRGYVNFVVGSSKKHGDDRAMIQSRTTFLSFDYYDVLRQRLIVELEALHAKVVVDAGCGEGYYTNALANRLSCEIYGFDLSKSGIDYACRGKSSAHYAVANVVHLPLAENFADVLLSVFAPYDIHEVKRVVKKDGYFVKVGPGPRHLYQLKQILYENVYENETLEALDDGFVLVKEIQVEDEICVREQEVIQALFQMTPYYWKSPKQGSERLKELCQLTTEIAFVIQIYKRK